MAKTRKQLYAAAVKRFWSNVTVTDGCWMWSGTTRNGGYGRLSLYRLPIAAHRLSWEIHNGSIPDGLCVLHSCDVPGCVNPDHLFLGTIEDNNLDRHSKGRDASNAGELNGRSILSRSEVELIRSRYTPRDKKYGLKALATRFCMSKSGMSHVLSGRNWK